VKMSLEKLFSEMLSNTCPKYRDEEGASIFIFDLCCKEMEIRAKCIEVIKDESDLPSEFKYELVSYKYL
jgi:hypothetical protein